MVFLGEPDASAQWRFVDSLFSSTRTPVPSPRRRMSRCAQGNCYFAEWWRLLRREGVNDGRAKLKLVPANTPRLQHPTRQLDLIFAPPSPHAHQHLNKE